MLDEYQEQQPIVYQIMKNAVLHQKVSHAYLIDTKNCMIGEKMTLAFAKYLLCPYNKSNSKDCGNCTQCKKIDDFNYIELKIIDADGLWIKKEQLDELQEEFSKKPLEGSYKVYIIHQVERLNKAAANSLLKFLEEPEEGIIAILTTNNLFQILETIRSRCQILSFSNEKKYDSNLESEIDIIASYLPTSLFDLNSLDGKEKYHMFVQSILDFIQFFEKKGKETLLYTEKLWHNKIHDKEELLLAFQIMTLFYHEVLNDQCERNIQIFKEEKDLITSISKQNTINQIIQKINIIMQQKKKIKINVNNGLLIDKLILDLLGGE